MNGFRKTSSDNRHFGRTTGGSKWELELTYIKLSKRMQKLLRFLRKIRYHRRHVQPNPSSSRIWIVARDPERTKIFVRQRQKRGHDPLEQEGPILEIRHGKSNDNQYLIKGIRFFEKDGHLTELTVKDHQEASKQVQLSPSQIICVSYNVSFVVIMCVSRSFACGYFLLASAGTMGFMPSVQRHDLLSTRGPVVTPSACSWNVMLRSTTGSSADLLPGIEAIQQNNAELLSRLEAVRDSDYFRLYSVDILGSCEYMAQELFECYTESCEIYPVDDDAVSVCGFGFVRLGYCCF